MSTGPDDKKKRFTSIAGGKAAPGKPIKPHKKRITNLAKPHIWVSRAGRGAKDRPTILEDASKLIKDLEKELGLNNPKSPKDK